MSNPLVRQVNEVHTHSVHLGMTTSYAQALQSQWYVCVGWKCILWNMLKIYMHMLLFFLKGPFRFSAPVHLVTAFSPVITSPGLGEADRQTQTNRYGLAAVAAKVPKDHISTSCESCIFPVVIQSLCYLEDVFKYNLVFFFCFRFLQMQQYNDLYTHPHTHFFAVFSDFTPVCFS